MQHRTSDAPIRHRQQNASMIRDVQICIFLRQATRFIQNTRNDLLGLIIRKSHNQCRLTQRIAASLDEKQRTRYQGGRKQGENDISEEHHGRELFYSHPAPSTNLVASPGQQYNQACTSLPLIHLLHTMPQVYPFTAIVGQERMKRALILNAIDPQIGGVLIRGERGTAKSTTARGLAALLPEIEIVEGCRFGCDPNQPIYLCTECQERLQQDGTLPVAQRRISFVNLPVSATEDRVVGTLDMEKAIQKGELHFDPGVLAAANRGMLYVDEINLLDDHVVDLLLDSAAMGVNRVEREGISFVHPARFILVGTMNPEEGDLRPQLLDRFAHAVDIEGIADSRARVEIVRRRLAYDQAPEAFAQQWQEAEAQLSTEIAQARVRLSLVHYSDEDLYVIANLTASFQVDGHRADIVILKTALANAAFEGRLKINAQDILIGAELALPHRMKRQPFQEGVLSPTQLSERLEQAREQAAAEFNEDEAGSAEGGNPSDVKKKQGMS